MHKNKTKYLFILLLLVGIPFFFVQAESIHLGGRNYPVFQNWLLLDAGQSGENIRIGFGKNTGKEIYWDTTSEQFTITDDVFVEGGYLVGVDSFFVDGTTGDVGIGTTTPSKTLDVAGDANITGNLTVETDVTVTGDLTVNGTSFTANTETVLVEDNTLVINNGEIGAGVTAGSSGVIIDRGSSDDYQLIFDETDDVFKVGIASAMEPIALREDSPTTAGIAFWDNGGKVFVTSANLKFDTTNGLQINDDFDISAHDASSAGLKLGGTLVTASATELNLLDGVTALLTEGGTNTLTNKTIDGDNNTISNLAHGAEVDNPTSGVHGVIGNIVGTSDTQTLTNKTLTSPTVSGGSMDNTVIGGTTPVAGSFTALTVIDGTNDLDIASHDGTNGLKLAGTLITSTAAELNLLDGITGTLATLAGTETLTNKTIAAGSNTISGLSHGTEVDNPSSGVHGVTGSVVGTADTQTLTNKTLTSPTVSGGSIDNATIGSTTPNTGAFTNITTSSWLNVGGSVTLPVKSVTTDYTITDQDFTLYANTQGLPSNIYWDLPAASTVTGRVYMIKLTGGNRDIFVEPNGAEEIDGDTNYRLRNPTDHIMIQSTGSEWIILSKDY